MSDVLDADYERRVQTWRAFTRGTVIATASVVILLIGLAVGLL